MSEKKKEEEEDDHDEEDQDDDEDDDDEDEDKAKEETEVPATTNEAQVSLSPLHTAFQFIQEKFSEINSSPVNLASDEWDSMLETILLAVKTFGVDIPNPLRPDSAASSKNAKSAENDNDEDEDGEVVVRVKCNSGHILKRFTTPTPGYTCDGECRRNQPMSTHLFSCRTCNFDMCRLCYFKKMDKLEKEALKAATAAAATQTGETTSQEDAANKAPPPHVEDPKTAKEFYPYVMPALEVILPFLPSSHNRIQVLEILQHLSSSCTKLQEAEGLQHAVISSANVETYPASLKMLQFLTYDDKKLSQDDVNRLVHFASMVATTSTVTTPTTTDKVSLTSLFSCDEKVFHPVAQALMLLLVLVNAHPEYAVQHPSEFTFLNALVDKENDEVVVALALALRLRVDSELVLGETGKQDVDKLLVAWSQSNLVCEQIFEALLRYTPSTDVVDVIQKALHTRFNLTL